MTALPPILESLKSKYERDSRVFDLKVSPTKKGGWGFSILCITRTQQKEIFSELTKIGGFGVYVQGPIWSLGAFETDTGKEFLKVSEEPGPTYDPQLHKEWRDRLEKMAADVLAEEEKIWDSFSVDQKGHFLNRWIRQQREKNPTYANCGDKFLKAN